MAEFQATANPNVFISRLPDHLRVNKSLPHQLRILFCDPIAVPDGSKVSVSAGNEYNPKAVVRNSEAVVKGGVAEFRDFRFDSRSGRGKKFNITISVCVTPALIVVVPQVIKITADGPRVRPYNYVRITESRRRTKSSMKLANSPEMEIDTGSECSLIEHQPSTSRALRPETPIDVVGDYDSDESPVLSSSITPEFRPETSTMGPIPDILYNLAGQPMLVPTAAIPTQNHSVIGAQAFPVRPMFNLVELYQSEQLLNYYCLLYLQALSTQQQQQVPLLVQPAAPSVVPLPELSQVEIREPKKVDHSPTSSQVMRQRMFGGG